MTFRSYVVGGAVRDRLLGREVHDRDHVVVGASADVMAQAGFLPVGRDFPVFLHPHTREEYALARTERKSGKGYHGFVFHADPSVTLQEDLARRDLTINAMAEDEAGNVIDPFDGQADLRRRVLRHVGPAFAEDPVRILRLARFAARFPDFAVAAETLEMVRRMVESGEVDALVSERVWQEIARGLMEEAPHKMLALLQATGVLGRLVPELAVVNAWPALMCGAASAHPLEARFALWLHDHAVKPENLRDVLSRLKPPAACADVASLVLSTSPMPPFTGDPARTAESLLAMIERTDALRRPDRFAIVLEAAVCANRLSLEASVRLTDALRLVRDVDAAAISRKNPDNIRGEIRNARLARLMDAS